MTVIGLREKTKMGDKDADPLYRASVLLMEEIFRLEHELAHWQMKYVKLLELYCGPIEDDYILKDLLDRF